MPDKLESVQPPKSTEECFNAIFQKGEMYAVVVKVGELERRAPIDGDARMRCVLCTKRTGFYAFFKQCDLEQIGCAESGSQFACTVVRTDKGLEFFKPHKVEEEEA